MMTSYDKRENSATRKGKDNIKQNSKKSLNLGKNFAPILPTPTCGVRFTNWHKGNYKIKLLCKLSKLKMEPIRLT
jgi:hypothetical protein